MRRSIHRNPRTPWAATWPEELLGNFQGMAGFRNVLIHEYARIDPEVVFGVLKRRLDDLRRFTREIGKLID